MTSKYTLIYEDDEVTSFGPGREIKHTITGEQTWPDLLNHIQDWLKGIGYKFDGTLEIMDGDENEANKLHDKSTT